MVLSKGLYCFDLIYSTAFLKARNSGELFSSNNERASSKQMIISVDKAFGKLPVRCLVEKSRYSSDPWLVR